MNSGDRIDYKSGGIELLDQIAPLWRQLIDHHSQLSRFFAEDIAARTFPKRRSGLIDKCQGGDMRVELACDSGASELIAYCVSTITADHQGEIDSIFVVDRVRGMGIGDVLMRRALEWLDARGATSTILEVAVGNERVHAFYARYGFFPNVTILEKKRSKFQARRAGFE